MKVRVIYRIVLALALMLVPVALAGCSGGGPRDGPYAEAKQNWDHPHTRQQLDALRNRLATTQRDN